MGLFSRDPDSGLGDGDAADEGPRFWQERGFVASAIVVGAVVVCLLVWVFARGSGTPTSQQSPVPSTVAPTEQPTEEPSVPPATPTEESTTTPGTPPPINGKGGCKNAHPDLETPLVAPPAVTWQFDADMLIPLQEAAGPAAMYPDGVRYCFAHSPTGAVLAALVLLGQIRNPDLTGPVLTTRVVPGSGQTRALAEARDNTTPEARGQVQFAGFKVTYYQSNVAIIQVAAELNNQDVASLPVTMVWSRGDWKAQLRPDGTFNGEVAPDVLQGLNGYVRFSGA